MRHIAWNQDQIGHYDDISSDKMEFYYKYVFNSL